MPGIEGQQGRGKSGSRESVLWSNQQVMSLLPVSSCFKTDRHVVCIFLIKILHNTILITPWKPLLCCFCQRGYLSISLVWSILVSSLNGNSRLGRRQHLVDVLKCHLRTFSLLTLGGKKSLQNGWPNSRFLTIKIEPQSHVFKGNL